MTAKSQPDVAGERQARVVGGYMIASETWLTAVYHVEGGQRCAAAS
jgi:hypothetical protein